MRVTAIALLAPSFAPRYRRDRCWADADCEDNEVRRVVPPGRVGNREPRLFSARSLIDSHSTDTGQTRTPFRSNSSRP